MYTLRWLSTAALAGSLLVAGAGLVQAQTSNSSMTGSSLGGSTTGGGGGGSGGVTGGNGVTGAGNSITGGSSTGFLTTSGAMVQQLQTPTTQTTNTFFRSGSNNPFVTYYTNPLAGALGTTNSTTIGQSAGFRGNSAAVGGFGMPLFANISTNSNMTTGGLGGAANIRGGAGMSGGTGRIPAYATVVDFEFRRPTAGQVQVSMQSMLDRTSALAGSTIRVRIDGPALVLEGTVVTDRQRRLAENMVRMTPGVHDVRNELNVAQVARGPRQ